MIASRSRRNSGNKEYTRYNPNELFVCESIIVDFIKNHNSLLATEEGQGRDTHFANGLKAEARDGAQDMTN